MQIKIKMKYHCTPIRVAKMQKTDNTKYRWECRAQELSLIAGGDQNGTATLEDS